MDSFDQPRTLAAALPGGFSLAATVGPGDPRKAVLFIHGFGSNRHYFRHAFIASGLKDRMCVAPDLPGFGESAGPEGYGFSMEDQARVLLDLLDHLGVEGVHLVAHSMGGIVALEVASLAPGRVRGLISLEGNLTGADCFFTQGIVAHSYRRFCSSGREEFLGRLEKMARETPLMAEYVESFRASSTMALYESARHTVSHSAAGLIDRFCAVPGAAYVYGERNRGRYEAEVLLWERGVPVHYIAGCGHFMALEEPEATFALVASLMGPAPR